MKKTTILIAALMPLIGLAACETVPNAEKAQMYENAMRAKFLGKSFDEVVLTYGPPNSEYALNDGRKMYQYSNSKTSTYSPGGTIQYGGVYGSRYSSYGFGIGFPFSFPYGTSEYTQACTKRFIVNNAKMVEDFKFEGNSCF